MRTLRLLLPALLAVIVAAAVAPDRTPVSAQAPGSAREAHEALQGVLWMQTSGEYWATASATYAAAKRAVDQALEDKRWTAATEQAGEVRKLPPAVILDLDETVLDNSKFQAQMILERKFYDSDRWNDWVKTERAIAVPGAVEFLRYAEAKNVKAFFVTNRTAEQEPPTISNLKTLSIAATPDNVLSNGENGWTSDKSARRAYLATTYRIVALVGDDMNDFVSMAGLTPSQRLDAARKYEAKWGTQWFILPNPLYGGWDRTLYTGITADEQVLAKKRATVTGF